MLVQGSDEPERETYEPVSSFLHYSHGGDDLPRTDSQVEGGRQTGRSGPRWGSTRGPLIVEPRGRVWGSSRLGYRCRGGRPIIPFGWGKGGDRPPSNPQNLFLFPRPCYDALSHPRP